MKALLVVLALLLGLGAAWWKTQNPTGTVEDFRQQAGTTLQRFGKGVRAVREDATQLDVQSARLDAFDTRLETLQLDAGMQGQTAEEFSATVDERLERINARLDTLSDEIAMEASMLSDPGGAGDTEDSTDGGVDDGADNSMATDSTGDADNATDATSAPVQRTDAALETRLARMEESLQATRDATVELQAGLAPLTARLDSLETQPDAAVENLSIDAQQRDMAAEIASLRSELEASNDNSAAANVAGEIGGLNQRIKSVEELIQSLPETSAEANDAQQQQADLQAQVLELEQRLSKAAATPDPALSDDLNSVKQEVAELASRDYVTLDDLREQQSGKTTEYKIYFGRNSIVVSSEAARVLDSFILQERNRATAVSIYGFTDRLGPAEYNQQLALQRAQAVRSYLVQKGFDYTKFTSLTGLGEDAASRTLDDEQGDANQRIVVLYAHHP